LRQLLRPLLRQLRRLALVLLVRRGEPQELLDLVADARPLGVAGVAAEAVAVDVALAAAARVEVLLVLAQRRRRHHVRVLRRRRLDRRRLDDVAGAAALRCVSVCVAVSTAKRENCCARYPPPWRIPACWTCLPRPCARSRRLRSCALVRFLVS